MGKKQQADVSGHIPVCHHTSTEPAVTSQKLDNKGFQVRVRVVSKEIYWLLKVSVI